MQYVLECISKVVPNECVVPTVESEYESVWEYGEFPVVESTNVCALPQGKVKISPLRFVNVNINGKTVRALKDSGDQIPLISETLVHEIPADQMGRIVIDSVVGSAIVSLVQVGVQLAAEPGTANLLTDELPVVCGAVDQKIAIFQPWLGRF